MPGVELEFFERLPLLKTSSTAIDVSVELEVLISGGTENTQKLFEKRVQQIFLRVI